MPTKYLSFPQLREKLGGRGRTTIYRDIEAGRLPKPLKFGNRLFWIEDEVDGQLADFRAMASIPKGTEKVSTRSDDAD